MRAALILCVLASCGTDVTSRRIGPGTYRIKAETRSRHEDVYESATDKAAELCPNGFVIVDGDKDIDEGAATFDGGKTYQKTRRSRLNIIVQCTSE